ncbi:splicing factor U2AF large subunit [Pontibacter akesuensis]|uniref:Uncharacterized protein n=1 Tax=Pontibacter akesuensis TaxID=388950 RepID=A0A1I7KSI5_9BACT|nr:hypothetical protein [Pontibacter akesuensis]GHA80907.1 hypothetical protein GCM10007389_39260 [Pontibacter akesuensis]SFV00423.1 hypothetical protein SAMN04487941_4054 [Pontibacter akesuensis]
MNRQDRGYYEYGPYEGYSRNDEHYHSARNLTNEFERDFQRDRGHWDENRDRARHSYHEGDMGDAYERYRRQGHGILNESSPRWNEREHDRYQANTYSNNRNRDNSSFWDSPRRDENWLNSDLNNNRGYNETRQDYGTSHRYNAYNRSNYRGAGDSRDTYSGSGGDDRRSRFGGGYYGSDRNSSTNWGDDDRRRYQTDRYY